MNNSPYVEWFEDKGGKLFKGAELHWKLYQGALVPAPASPCFVELSQKEARMLLKESGAWFIRYASNPCEDMTEWWYVVCDSYDPDKLSGNTRSKINRANRHCTIQKIGAEWLAQNGYECYFAAYSRYKNAKPMNKEHFYNNILKTDGGPFEFWGIFVGNILAGYCQCIVEEPVISTSVIKYHPEYLKYYTSYALITNIINHYVIKKGMIINNGTRSISHDTMMQPFLLKLGFRRQFCHLNIIYQPWLKFALQTLFPLGRLIDKIPDRGSIHKLNALLHQEELRKKCNVTSF